MHGTDAMLRMKTVSVEMFFDRKKVIRAADRANQRDLSKAGAFIRATAKHSIRKRKGALPPGSPPSSHTGLLKRFIFFGYDAARKTVVVGPMRLNQKVGDAPAALEHGGTSVVVEGLRRRRRRRRKRRVRIRARPFMGPAMQKELPKFPKLWTESVR
jgi:hypothetical protein